MPPCDDAFSSPTEGRDERDTSIGPPPDRSCSAQPPRYPTRGETSPHFPLRRDAQAGSVPTPRGVEQEVSRWHQVAFEPHTVRPIDLLSTNEDGAQVGSSDDPQNLEPSPLASYELTIPRRRILERHPVLAVTGHRIRGSVAKAGRKDGRELV